MHNGHFCETIFLLKYVCLTLQANAIINSLTASVSKVHAALADLNGHHKPEVWLMPYITTTKDKQVR